MGSNVASIELCYTWKTTLEKAVGGEHSLKVKMKYLPLNNNCVTF